MKYIDICYLNFSSVLHLFHEHLLWLRESALFFFFFFSKWTKGEQNHKISCGWGTHKWRPKQGLQSRQINSFTRKGRHHISEWCKVLQAPQIQTTITCCGNAKQIQPWFGSSQGWLCLKRELYSSWRWLRKSISTGVQLKGPFDYKYQKCKINTADSE